MALCRKVRSTILFEKKSREIVRMVCVLDSHVSGAIDLMVPVDGSPAMTSKAWAKEVVSETLKSPTKLKAHFWIGPLSSVVWFANWFLPRTAFVSLHSLCC